MDLVQERLPALWSHLGRLNVDLSLFTLSWFITVFVDTLPHDLYINIYDVFLYEGNKVCPKRTLNNSITTPYLAGAIPICPGSAEVL